MKEEFFAKLEHLVVAAKDYRRSGFRGVDPEEATKQHLIEPLLESLGYTRDDFDKEFHILGGQVDYRLKHHRPLIFLEAKSLLDKSPNLFENHKQQVLDYIRNFRYDPNAAKWEQPVNWIVLTNFAQFHFIRVTEESPSFSFTLDELLPRREQLWELLALESVEANRIDELYDQQLKAELDKRFLADLKRWRLIIANGFALRNAGVSLPDLTKASQQLLDRFIFCRMLEAHRLTEYNRLARQFAHYDELYPPPPMIPFSEFLRKPLFADIKDKFNTELFDQPQLCDQLEIDNEALAVVIGHQPLTSDIAGQCGIEHGQGELLPSFKHLYGYDFSRMSGDVMGAVYERFLAHKLDHKGGRIVIEDTDELRKKEGIYYTPRYIVDYIVAHTVGEKIKPILTEALSLLAYKNPKGARSKIGELAQIKVLDAAMGSGSFLLRAFDAFVDAYHQYNAECVKLTQQGRQSAMTLFDAPQDIAETVEKIGIRVVTENIFGVDLDEQAVEIAKLNLWTRVMATERDSIREFLRFSQTARKITQQQLPTLANNLKCGNSLIDDATVVGHTAFHWQNEFPEIMERGGFDCVVGNPPYERIQTMMGNAPKLVEFLKANYQSAAAGNFDIYVCFIERGLHLLSPNGTFGYICPNKFFQTEYGRGLRKLLSDGKHVRKVVSFGDLQVFPQVSTYTCLLFLSKEGLGSTDYSLVGNIDTFAATEALAQGFAVKAESLSESPWNFIGEGAQSWMKKTQNGSKPLGEVAEEIFVGLQTSADDVFLFEAAAPLKSTCEVFSTALGKPVKLETRILKPVVRSGEIGRFWAQPTHLVLFPYRLTKGVATLLAEKELRENFPLAWDYLKSNELKLAAREHGKFKDKGWWQLYPKNLEFWETPKVMLPYMIQRLSAFYDGGRHYFVNVTTGGFGVRCKSETQNRFITGLLNSTLLDAYLRQISTNFRGGYFAANKQFIEQLPIKTIDPKSKKDAALAKQIIHHVETIQEAHRQRLELPRKLMAEVLRSHRTDCSLAHYVQKDYAAAVTAEILIDDVRRKGFVRSIVVQSGKKHIIIAAEVSATKDAAPVVQPIVRLTFTNPALQQFIYASWRNFLETNARKKTWTTGKTAQPIYDLILNGIQPLAFFQMDAADNLRAIRDLMKSVAKEVGTSNLAAVEHEIADTDEAINQLVYQLYSLTDEEIQIVEGKQST